MKEGKLPDGWEWKRLGDIADINSGVGFPLEYQEEFEGQIPFYKVMDISKTVMSRDKYLQKSDYFISQKNCDIINAKPFKIGTIVFAKIGAALLLNRRAILACEALFDNNIMGLIPDPLKIDKLFLYYLFLTVDLGEICHTTSVPSIRKSDVENLKIPIPPLPTQRQIVAILEQAESTKRLRAESHELTRRFLQSVFMEMFGDPVKNEKGWKTEKLVDLCLKHFGGGTPSKSKPEYYLGNIPWVSPKDMKSDFIWDSIDHISEGAITNSSTQKAPIGSLLMVIRSAILKKYLPVAITKVEVTINQDMKAFVFDEKRTNAFFMFYFFKSYQKALLTKVRAVTADNIEFNQIKSIDVIVPPLALQQEFARIVEQMEALRECQRQSAGEINLLFEGLMQKAFTGELVA